jgi:hypothetical protein
MKTLRLLTTIVGIITTLAIIAAPASANFEANGNTSQGPYTISGPAVFSTAVIVSCATLERGAWHIQKSDTKQELTKQGGHQELTGQFTKCTAEIGGLKSTAKINSGCALQIKQTGATTFTGSVTSNCSITRNTCIITIAAGAPNTELKEVKVINITKSPEGNEEKSNVGGITNSVNAPCEELGVKGNAEGTFVATGIATGEKII